MELCTRIVACLGIMSSIMMVSGTLPSNSSVNTCEDSQVGSIDCVVSQQVSETESLKILCKPGKSPASQQVNILGTNVGTSTQTTQCNLFMVCEPTSQTNIRNFTCHSTSDANETTGTVPLCPPSGVSEGERTLTILCYHTLELRSTYVSVTSFEYELILEEATIQNIETGSRLPDSLLPMTTQNTNDERSMNPMTSSIQSSRHTLSTTDVVSAQTNATSSRHISGDSIVAWSVASCSVFLLLLAFVIFACWYNSRRLKGARLQITEQIRYIHSTSQRHPRDRQAAIADHLTNQLPKNVEYMEIGEQEYHVIFGGKEMGDYHKYEMPGARRLGSIKHHRSIPDILLNANRDDDVERTQKCRDKCRGDDDSVSSRTEILGCATAVYDPGDDYIGQGVTAGFNRLATLENTRHSRNSIEGSEKGYQSLTGKPDTCAQMLGAPSNTYQPLILGKKENGPATTSTLASKTFESSYEQENGSHQCPRQNRDDTRPLSPRNEEGRGEQEEEQLADTNNGTEKAHEYAVLERPSTEIKD